MVKQLKPKQQHKRRWLLYGTIVVLLVTVVALYETQQELGRQQGQAGDSGELSLSELNDRGRSDLRSYYRSHDLPSGWEIGSIEAAENPTTVRITIHFAPSILSQRHGEAARPGEMTTTTACPTDRAPWNHLNRLVLEITTADKTGRLDTFECIEPPAEQVGK